MKYETSANKSSNYNFLVCGIGEGEMLEERRLEMSSETYK